MSGAVIRALLPAAVFAGAAAIAGATGAMQADMPPPAPATPRHGVVMESRVRGAIAGVRVRATVLDNGCVGRHGTRDTTVTTNDRGGYTLPLGGCRAYVTFERSGYRSVVVRWPQDLSPDGSVCSCVELNVTRMDRIGDPDPPDPDASPDDALVYEEILTHTIRPQAARGPNVAKSFTPPPVIVIDRTIATCQKGIPHNHRLGCVPEFDIERIASSDTTDWGLFHGQIYPTARAELARGFRTRNAGNHPIPAGALDGVIRVAQEQLDEVEERESAEAVGYAGFSRPSYSADGHAVIYAAYSCGNLCGTCWFFLLEREEGNWRVVSVAVIGKS